MITGNLADFRRGLLNKVLENLKKSGRDTYRSVHPTFFCKVDIVNGELTHHPLAWFILKP